MDPITILQSITILSITKVMIVVLLLVYVVFALLMMRQITAMTKAVTMKDDYIIRILGVLNFVFAVLVFLIALFIL
ncbi:MAG: DUF5657 family protein [Microgenomates group bacterium]